jgi:hypothetical protein
VNSIGSVRRYPEFPPAAGDVSLGIVIPTRNRARLAIEAARSVLREQGCRFDVFVSDNSTDETEVRLLADFCAREADPRLTYLRPEAALGMPAHWDWALRTAMARSAATHFTIHYDRRITKPGNLSLICSAVAAFPLDVVTFMFDLVTKDYGRSRVWQWPWDGHLYEIPTALVAEMTSRGQITEMGQAFPVLSNCAVPRAVLQTVAQRFGDVCVSTAPDSSFTYRFCATHGRYVHYDRNVGIAYAFERSTGMGYVRGGGDFGDFMQDWGDRPWLDAAPIPGLNMGQNVLFHEYELVRRETRHPAFKPIDFQGYLCELGRSLLQIEDPVQAAELRALLRRHGWEFSMLVKDAPRPEPPRAIRVRDGLPWMRTLLRDLWRQSGLWYAPVVADEKTGVAGRLRATIWGTRDVAKKVRRRVNVLFADYCNRPPGDLTGYEFRTDAGAIARLLAWPRKRCAMSPRLAWLEPVENADDR